VERNRLPIIYGRLSADRLVLTIENIPLGKDHVSERWLLVRKNGIR